MAPDEPGHDDRELDDALRAHLQGAGARLEVTPATLAQVEARGRQRRRRRRSAGALVGVLSVVGAVAGVGSLVDGDDGDPIATEGLPATTTSPPDAMAPSTNSAAEAELDDMTMSTTAPVASTVVAWGDGFLAFQQSFAPQPLPALPQELIDRFPPEVVDLFAEGMPATIDEAMTRLEVAGLLDVVTEIVNADPELMDAIYAEPPAAPVWEPLWSPDGENWEPVEGSVPAPLVNLEAVATDGDRLVVAGTSWRGEAGVEQQIMTVESTTDLVAWESWELPAVGPADLPDWVTAFPQVRRLAVRDDRWIAVVEVFLSVDIEPPPALLEEYGASASSGWSTSWGSSQDGVEFGFPSGSDSGSIGTDSEERVFVSWEELGIDPEDAARYLEGGPPDVAVFLGGPGAPPVPAEAPASVQEVVATASGFALLGAEVSDGSTGGPVVYVSADGAVFRPAAAQPASRETWISALATVGDGLVAVVNDQAGMRLLRSDAWGSSWRALTVPGLPEGALSGGGRTGLTGSLPGLALEVDAAVRSFGPAVEELVLEVDGYRITLSLGDIGDEGYELVDLATGAVVSAEIVDAAGPEFDPDAPFEHAFERDGELVLLDPAGGEELLVVSRVQIAEAYEAAYQASGFDPDAVYVPDLWLIASVDGETWLVEDLPERVTWFGEPVLGATGVLVSGENGWTLVPFG
jgi:hypothetical protein